MDGLLLAIGTLGFFAGFVLGFSAGIPAGLGHAVHVITRVDEHAIPVPPSAYLPHLTRSI